MAGAAAESVEDAVEAETSVVGAEKVETKGR